MEKLRRDSKWRRRENLLLKFRIAAISVFAVVSMNAYSSIANTVPIDLDVAEWRILFDRIHYPIPSLKNRKWRATTLPHSREIIFTKVESEYYENEPEYKRYYVINCERHKRHWKCESAQNRIEITGLNAPVWVKNSVSSAEIIRINEFLKSQKMSWPTYKSNATIHLRSISKLKNKYYAEIFGADPYCFWNITISPNPEGGLTISDISGRLCE